jgi:hypothetical protein
MPVSRADLLIYQGTDYAATVHVEYIDGSPVDLTSWTAKAQIRRGPADCYPAIDYEIGTTIQPPDNVILTIPHDVTQELCGRYSWDLDLISPLGMISTVLAGAAIVTAEVTREAATA